MDTGRRLVAGSRNRNEFVVINADDFERVSAIKMSSFYPGVRSFLDSWVIVDGATHPEFWNVRWCLRSVEVMDKK